RPFVTADGVVPHEFVELRFVKEGSLGGEGVRGWSRWAGVDVSQAIWQTPVAEQHQAFVHQWRWMYSVDGPIWRRTWSRDRYVAMFGTIGTVVKMAEPDPVMLVRADALADVAAEAKDEANRLQWRDPRVRSASLQVRYPDSVVMWVTPRQAAAIPVEPHPGSGRAVDGQVEQVAEWARQLMQVHQRRQVGVSEQWAGRFRPIDVTGQQEGTVPLGLGVVTNVDARGPVEALQQQVQQWRRDVAEQIDRLVNERSWLIRTVEGKAGEVMPEGLGHWLREGAQESASRRAQDAAGQLLPASRHHAPLGNFDTFNMVLQDVRDWVTAFLQGKLITPLRWEAGRLSGQTHYLVVKPRLIDTPEFVGIEHVDELTVKNNVET